MILYRFKTWNHQSLRYYICVMLCSATCTLPTGVYAWTHVMSGAHHTDTHVNTWTSPCCFSQFLVGKLINSFSLPSITPPAQPASPERQGEKHRCWQALPGRCGRRLQLYFLSFCSAQIKEGWYEDCFKSSVAITQACGESQQKTCS